MQKFIFSLLSCLFGFLLILLADAQADQKGIGGAVEGLRLEDAASIWHLREKKAPSFSAKWKVRHTYAKGSLLHPALPLRVNPKKMVVPADDYTFVTDFSLKVDGEKTRYEYNWTVWNTTLSTYESGPRTEIFDGKMNTLFTGRAEGLSTAAIRPEAFSLAYGNFQTRAIVLALRPTRLPPREFGTEALVSTGQRQVIANSMCYMARSQGSSWRYWIDPNMGFAIVRCYSESKAGTPIRNLEIKWIREQDEWLPNEWHLSSFHPDGMLREDSFGFDVQYQLDKALSAADFEFSLPPKTVVIDGKNREKPPEYHVIDTEQSKRPISNRDILDPDWQKLVAPERHFYESWVTWILVGIPLAILMFFALRGKI